MKIALMILALLIAPAKAETIYLYDYPQFSTQIAEAQATLINTGYYCLQDCIPRPLVWSQVWVGLDTLFGNTGDNIFYIFGHSPSAVPEPAIWGMMLCGFGFLGFWRVYRGRA
jgi:hypothetical protein